MKKKKTNEKKKWNEGRRCTKNRRERIQEGKKKVRKAKRVLKKYWSER